MGEVLSGASHFPDPFVGPLPSVLEEIDEGQDQVEGVEVAVEDGAATALIQRVDDLAVHVELELLGSRVADAHRLRPLVPGQPGNLPLREPALAGRAVHDLQVVGLAGGGAQEPSAPRLRLLLVPRVQKGEKREDRKSTRLNSSHSQISYAVFCLKKKKTNNPWPDGVAITAHATPGRITRDLRVAAARYAGDREHATFPLCSHGESRVQWCSLSA